MRKEREREREKNQHKRRSKYLYHRVFKSTGLFLPSDSPSLFSFPFFFLFFFFFHFFFGHPLFFALTIVLFLSLLSPSLPFSLSLFLPLSPLLSIVVLQAAKVQSSSWRKWGLCEASCDTGWWPRWSAVVAAGPFSYWLIWGAVWWEKVRRR